MSSFTLHKHSTESDLLHDKFQRGLAVKAASQRPFSYYSARVFLILNSKDSTSVAFAVMPAFRRVSVPTLFPTSGSRLGGPGNMPNTQNPNRPTEVSWLLTVASDSKERGV